MAIQFFCSSCSKPIEVDNELANQAVTCPYCRSVVTTPAVSDPNARLGAASPDAPEAAAGSPPVGLLAIKPPRRGSSVWAYVSLAAVSLSLVSFAIYLGTFASIFQEQAAKQVTAEEMNRIYMQEMSKRPGLSMMLAFGFCGGPILGIITAVIALATKSATRWPAIVSLIVASLLLVLFLIGTLLQAGGAGPPGAAS